MRNFLRFIKKIWFLLLIIAFAGYLLLGINVIPIGVMVDEMIRTADAGTLIDNHYTNYKLGIQFFTPPVENGNWRPMTYQEQFTHQPYYVYKANKAEFTILQPNNKIYPDFIFRARYDAIKTFQYKNESSAELAIRLRKELVREIVSGNRDDEGMFDHSFVYTDVEPAVINNKTYYKYSTIDKDEDLYFLTYVIREGDFGFRFMFYGQGEEIDQNFVKEVMHSIVYFEQDFTVDYKRKGTFSN